MDDVPNARIVPEDKEVKYRRIADVLKIRYRAEVDEGGKWLTFNSANLHVELNGQPISLCTFINIDIRDDDAPRATLGLQLESIDIDMDTMIALQAIVDTKKAMEDGDETSKPD